MNLRETKDRLLVKTAEKKLFVLGVGPGGPDYVLPIVRQRVVECDVLVGGKRNLAIFQAENKRKIVIGADVQAVIAELRELVSPQTDKKTDCQAGILVTGDPGFYSFLGTLLRYFRRDELDVYPGISSLQYLFAKGVLTWQDGYLTSLHGKGPENLPPLVREHAKLALLTDGNLPPGEIARLLLQYGVKGKRALVGESLSYPEERIRDRPLADWVGVETADLSVMVIYDE
ncbi:MAG: precorrin-6y C5,15-methyltransferase (decarboxylating) subunit CbiE [Desulfitobacteriaceae bacterium]|nr:precorrin-6y C5,15-methyltransferase (decarboxylating) subunit CbiE [Clostridia bacterium]MDD4346158.1 precorrin-6y C5,15-methyltransferase (decarboxylating) subunit CbiE [Desulfitobacteriaceae bacterium]MDD4400619.1 precorrin-6y C5,15-methyltransferase (decarboxylating) subunit CbiE [Desulfitobacteriaceae bacterium]